MWNGQDSLYGLEWIEYDQEYYKITIAEDGVYRIPQANLVAAGIPMTAVSGNDFQLFAYGEEIPIYVTTNGNFGGTDYIEFYAEKNTSQLDKFLFEQEEDQLNPDFSIVTDEAAYYLTWNGTGNGQRYTTLTNDPSGSPLNYFTHTSTLNFNNRHYSWKDANNVKFSNFDSGEGFAGPYDTEHSIDIPTPFLVDNGPASRFNLNMFSDLLAHNLEVTLNGTVISSQEFGGHRLVNVNEAVSNASLQDENVLTVTGSFDNNDRYAIAIAEITYPRSFDLDGANFFSFEIATGNKSLIEITNLDLTSGNPVFYDIKNKTRITGDNVNGTVRYGLPAGSQDRQVVVVNNDTGVKNVGTISKVEFEDFSISNSNYIIITHPLLNNADNGTNVVQEYAAFRASAAGGSYDVQVINVTDLYEVFSYGVQRHPISIRNFANYIKKNWPNPEMVFLLGKGRKYEQTRTAAQLNNPINESFYVPTLGTPGSDNLMLASPNSDIAVLPVGRLAASTKEEVTTYLNKMKDMVAAQNGPQTIDDKGWMKSILHLSGGDVTIQGIISSALANFESIIEEPTFGGDVTTFYKTSTDPIQISESEGIFDLINEGVSLITFFGHSGTGTFDFNIDNPDNFSNQGKLPLIISLGCYSGDIHTSGSGVSERFVFYEGKAAGSFLATTGPGYISALRAYGNSFYRSFGEDHYGEPLAKIIRESLIPLNGNTGITIRTLVQQLTLNGDPAILMNPHPGPDLVVDGKSVTFKPEVLNAQLDSFEMSFDVVNLGRAVSDSVQLVIEQQLPSGDKFSLRSDRILAPFSRKTITVKLPNYGTAAAGLNRFFIEIDTELEVSELPSPLAEMNNAVIGADNIAGIPVFIFDNSLEPLFPQDFGIVNDDQPVKLVCSTRDALVEEQDWLVEIDTTENFNSPFKKSEKFTQRGGVLNWEPPVAWENERVYYWRVSPDSTSAASSYIWKNRSFVYLADSEPGWNQSHYYQYKQNEFEGMEVLPGEEFEYLKNGFFVTLRNKVKEPNDEPQYIYNFGNPAISVRPWNWLNSGIAFVVGDKVTGGGWRNYAPGDYGSVNPPASSFVFAFPTSTEAERATVIEFIENVITDDSYVFCFSVLKDVNQDFNPETWALDEQTNGKSIFSVLEDQGATKIRNLESGSRPYTFVFQKNNQVFAEDLANDFNSTIVTEVFIPTLLSAGTFSTQLVGPAASWSSFDWSLELPDDVADISFIQLIGVKTSGEKDTLQSNLVTPPYDLSNIDAAQYPYLEIGMTSGDNALRTASNLNYWRITYEGLPDLALDPNEFLTIYQDSLQEGEQFKFETAVTNTSHKTISNTQVRATFSNDGESTLQSVGIKELIPGESTNITFNLETFQNKGNNNLLIEANPSDSPKELYRFNNFGTYNFFVNSDNTNPLLEVTFDGSPIMNGDIISAKPHVIIRLKDENPFLSLKDTSLLKLILINPEKETRGIFFSNPAVNFIPADDDKNEAYIEWDPTFDLDGDYQFIVQGEDVTGNQSGSIDYKINFKIINKKMISNVLNYPNPFTTSTRFVYTLTGDETPAYFKIQIYTASGRIVKEITQDELGPMKIGTHQTDYVWDGTDDFGDRLANGVYFYKVITKNAEGENYEAMLNGSVDKYFEQDFGKLVIMR